jgi:hypothetical protein
LECADLSALCFETSNKKAATGRRTPKKEAGTGPASNILTSDNEG